nr:TauD/TfdA family dioxygenase [uncultured Actinoplanes sp.]
MVVNSVDLSPTEAFQCRQLAGQISAAQEFVAVRKAIDLAAQLPSTVCELSRLLTRGTGSGGIALIRGVPLGDAVAIPTPEVLSAESSSPAESDVERLMLVLAGAFGNPFSFASQQRGRLVLDIFPVRGQESSQLGSSSKEMMEWHAEHAFHPRRAHHILLLCLRNDQKVATRYAFASDLKLSPDVIDELRRPQFVIIPDESHSEAYNAAMAGARNNGSTPFSTITTMASQPRRIAVLEGHDDVTISVDFPYMPAGLHSARANAALCALREAIEEIAESVVLGPGDLLVLDNRRGVHAREGFTARYDGTDRWLKQLSVRSRSRSSSPGESDVHVY